MTKMTDENDNLVEITDDNGNPIEKTVENGYNYADPFERRDIDEAVPVVETKEESPAPAIDPEMIAILKKQIMQELKSEKEVIRQEIIEAREEAKKAQDIYVEQMKASHDPWVDIQGWVTTEQGVRVELDWNDAFVAHLKSEGIKGADDDQVVQKWVTLLLRDMSSQLEDESPEQSEYE